MYIHTYKKCTLKIYKNESDVKNKTLLNFIYFKDYFYYTVKCKTGNK